MNSTEYPNIIDLDVSEIAGAEIARPDVPQVIVLSEPRDGDVIRYMTPDEARGLAYALLEAITVPINYGRTGEHMPECPAFVSYYPWETSADREVWGNGMCDGVGSTDAPGGHWYRIDNRLVTNDERGEATTFVFATWLDAAVALDHIASQLG